MRKTLDSREQLQAEAARFVTQLSPKPEHATLVTLSGELGAGKTSFVQGAAGALGVREPVTSPTFVLEKSYALPEGGPFRRLVHIDAYRLAGERSLAPLGFAHVYAEPSNLIFLEWPSCVQELLPPADHALALSVVGDGRDIAYA